MPDKKIPSPNHTDEGKPNERSDIMKLIYPAIFHTEDGGKGLKIAKDFIDVITQQEEYITIKSEE